MSFLIMLACSAVACALLRNPLRRAPWVFYLLACAMVATLFAGNVFGLPREVNLALLTVVRKCQLATALFVIVAYIGVLPRDSTARRWMQPVRGPVSIVASILAVGHMVQYLMAYLPRIFGPTAVAGNVMASFVVAVALFALVLVLGVTSFNFVKRRMGGQLWKHVQWFAYVFYALVYAHVIIMFAPAAIRGGAAGVANVAVYTVVFGAYLVLRVMRARADAREAAAARGPLRTEGAESVRQQALGEGL